MNQEQIQRLNQIVIQDTYDKQQVREVIMQDIKQSNTEGIISDANLLLNKYIDGSYYASKNARIKELALNCPLSNQDLIIEVLALILVGSEVKSFQEVVGKLAPQLEMQNSMEAIKTSGELLAVLCETNLYDIIAASDSDTGGLVIKRNCALNKETTALINAYQYLPPMIVKPETILSNTDSAYLLKKESVILGKGNHHNKTQALDAINIANKVKLSLDTDVLGIEELPSKPLGSKEQREAWDLLVRSSKQVYKTIVEAGNEFYFGWRFDKRGRMYSQGYHINIQSTEYKKALINLTNKEVIHE